MRLLLYYSVLHSLLYRQVFSQTFVFSEGKRKSRSRRAWYRNSTSSSKMSLRHSFLHPCKKLKQNTHYFQSAFLAAVRFRKIMGVLFTFAYITVKMAGAPAGVWHFPCFFKLYTSDDNSQLHKNLTVNAPPHCIQLKKNGKKCHPPAGAPAIFTVM